MSNKVIELFDRFDIFEKDILNSMVLHDREIVDGINVIRDFINKMLPCEVDLNFKNKLVLMIDNYQKELASRMRVINQYTYFGMSRCLSIVDNVISIDLENFEIKKKIITLK